MEYRNSQIVKVRGKDEYRIRAEAETARPDREGNREARKEACCLRAPHQDRLANRVAWSRPKENGARAQRL